MSSIRRSPVQNPKARAWRTPEPFAADGKAQQFHKKLPGYEPTPLRSLPDVANSIGVANVYLKDESNRLGLPSFKILGASWGTFRAIVNAHGLSLDTDLDTVRESLRSRPTTLFAATDGNHGRAVAFIARILNIKATIFVPTGLSLETIGFINSEGATIIRDCGSYDNAVLRARDACMTDNGTLVQDTAFEDYREIPTWIVEGYSTIFHEIDDQLEGKVPSLVVSPVGVGSLAQAVVSFYKSSSRRKTSAVVTVEPDTAACFLKSLRKQQTEQITATETIMDGMQCGRVSTIAWPILSKGVDMSFTITDYEAHKAVEYLDPQEILVGPCGAATLAVLQRFSNSDKHALELDNKSVIVLLCTEGARTYSMPYDVSSDSPAGLYQTLTLIERQRAGSIRANPFASYVAEWLEHRDILKSWQEFAEPKAICISACVNGTDPNAKSVTFYTCMDGSEMRTSVTAALITLADVKKRPIKGTVRFIGYTNANASNAITAYLFSRGWKTDYVIILTQTQGKGIITYSGLAKFTVEFSGDDSTTRQAYFLVDLDKYDKELQGRASSTSLSIARAIPVSTSIATGPSSTSTVNIERYVAPSETLQAVEAELFATIAKGQAHPFPKVTTQYVQSTLTTLPPDDAFLKLFRDKAKEAIGAGIEVGIGSPTLASANVALLKGRGIRSIAFGPPRTLRILNRSEEKLLTKMLKGIATEFH